MIKNIIIFSLTLVIIIVCFTDDLQEWFDGFMDQDYREDLHIDRINSVNSSSKLNISMIFDAKDFAQSEYAEGVLKAVALINKNGGIKGRLLNLSVDDTASDKRKYLALLEKYCRPTDVAICIGPFDANYVVSGRALTHEAAVPYLSVVPVMNEKLPVLADENFVSYSPNINDLAKPLLKSMIDDDVNNIIILSPEGDSYGSMFSTVIERKLSLQPNAKGIFHISYQQPFSKEQFSRILDFYIKDKNINNVFFSGNSKELESFVEILKGYDSEVTIYGTQLLQDDATVKNASNFNWRLPVFDFLKANSKVADNLQKLDNTTSYRSVIGASMIFTFSDILEKQKKYDPNSIVNTMKKEIAERFLDENLNQKILELNAEK